MKYAKKKGGSKAKRKGTKNTGHPVALWHKCNTDGPFAGRGEFVNGKQTEKQAANGEIPRGHVHLPGCGCLSRADWDDNYSEEFLAARASAKAHEKRILVHQKHGSICGVCFQLLSVSGVCGC